MASTLTDKLEFAIALAREIAAQPARAKPAQPTAYRVAKLASTLVRYARALHTAAEEECNGIPDSEYADHDKAVRRIKVRAVKALEPYGITPVFSGDPRGACLKLQMPHTRANNDFGGEGYCVPL